MNKDTLKKWWRHKPVLPLALKIALGFLALVCLTLAIGIALLTSPKALKFIAGVVSEKTGREIMLEGDSRIYIERHPRLVLSQIKIGNAKWAKEPYFFEAQKVEVALNPWPLFRGQMVLPKLVLDQPKISLEKNAEGDANWDMTENPEAKAVTVPVPEQPSEMPIIDYLKINNGNVSFHDAAKKITTNVEISTVQGEAGTEERMQVKGEGDYKGAPFKLDLKGASILQLRDTAEAYPFELSLAIGNTKADMKGTVQDPSSLKALDIDLTLKGANAADLFPITGIALPPTPNYQVSGKLVRHDDIWDFTEFTGKLGSSDLRGSVSWHADQKPPYFEGDFTSNNLDMADLAGFIGADKKPDNDNRVIPDKPLDISRLIAMNADVKFQSKRVKAPDLLDDFLMVVTLKDGTLTLHPLSFGLAKGKIKSDVTIEGLKNPPFITADVLFQRLSLKQLFEPLAKRYGEDNVTAGVIGGRATLKGSGKSLRDILATSDGKIGIGLEGAQLSRLLLELIGLDIFKATGLILTGDQPVDMNCVVGDFNVKTGVMNTNEFLIESDVTTIRGEGTINLKNEAMKLRLLSYPKDPSLFSARAPILIGGTLKKPGIGVDPAALAARGGLAAALGALLTPLGSLLAFIEPGLGEESNCSAFLKQVDQKTGGAIPGKQ